MTVWCDAASQSANRKSSRNRRRSTAQ